MESITTRSIYVSTSCLPGEQPVSSRISVYQRHGLNAIELGAGVSVDETDLSKIADVKAKFIVHNYFPPPSEAFVLNLASSDDNIRRKSLDMAMNAIDLAARIGASFYSVHAGFITDPTFFNASNFVFPEPSGPDEASSAMNRFAVSMKLVSDHAKSRGVGVLIENNVCTEKCRGKLLLQSSEEFISLFSILQPSHPGVLLDTGHLNVSAHTLGFDRMAFVNAIAHYVRAFHVHDNDGKNDTHQPIRPDSWVMDVLRRPEFMDLPIIVEAKFNSVIELCEHVDWLKHATG